MPAWITTALWIVFGIFALVIIYKLGLALIGTL